MIYNGKNVNKKHIFNTIAYSTGVHSKSFREVEDALRNSYNAKLSRFEFEELISTHSIRYDYKRSCEGCKFCDLCCLVPALRIDLNSWKHKNIIGLSYKPEYKEK